MDKNQQALIERAEQLISEMLKSDGSEAAYQDIIEKHQIEVIGLKTNRPSAKLLHFINSNLQIALRKPHTRD